MRNVIIADVTNDVVIQEVTDLIVVYVGMENALGNSSNSAHDEIANDNNDGTYTTNHTPNIIFIDGGKGRLGVNYSVLGNVITLLKPSGAGYLVENIY